MLGVQPVTVARHIGRASGGRGALAATIATLKDVIGRMPARGWDPIDDVQVLCAVNEKSPLSRKTPSPSCVATSVPAVFAFERSLPKAASQSWSTSVSS